MVQPDNFSLYQPLVAGSLWLAARGLRGEPRSFVARRAARRASRRCRATTASSCWRCSWRRLAVGPARGRASAFGGRAGRAPPRIPLVAALGAVALFVLAVAPWYARQLATFGSLSPSTASGKVLFIRDIGEWNSITIPATLDHLLGMGIGPLLLTRVGGFVAAAFIFSVLVGVLVLVPFMVVGAWRRRRDATVRAVLRLRGPAVRVQRARVRGPRPGRHVHPLGRRARAARATSSRSRGSSPGIEWLAARRRAGTSTSAARVFVGGAVGVRRRSPPIVGAERRPRDVGRQAPAACRPSPPRSTRRARPRPTGVMSIDASGYRYWTGRRGVVLVNDPLDTVEQVAARVRHPLARPRARGQRRGRRATILVDDQRPAWVGPADPRDRRRRRLPGLPRRRRPRAVRTARRRAGPMSRREAWLTRARRVRRRARACASSRRRSSTSPSPRTRPTTSASPATSSRAAGLVSDALWSYGTPPLVFPRPAFEVWLPLPSLLAAIPIALAGRGRADPARDGDARVAGRLRRSRARSSPVLAWRLAARRRRGARPARRAGADARDRGRAHGGRLPAAAPPLRAARLDDAVRRPRPRRRAC